MSSYLCFHFKARNCERKLRINVVFTGIGLLNPTYVSSKTVAEKNGLMNVKHKVAKDFLESHKYILNKWIIMKIDLFSP